MGKPLTRKGEKNAAGIYLRRSCAGEKNTAMVPAHEIMHVMGRYHEQQRKDRNDYITITSYNSCKILLLNKNYYQQE